MIKYYIAIIKIPLTAIRIHKPSILTDDLKKEADSKNLDIYNTVEECQAACDNLNK
jgi:hypothetical protein